MFLEGDLLMSCPTLYNNCLQRDRRLGLWRWCCETQHLLLILVSVTTLKNSEKFGVDRWNVGPIRLIIKGGRYEDSARRYERNLDVARLETSVWMGCLRPPGRSFTFVCQNRTFLTRRPLPHNGFPPLGESACLLFISPLPELFILRGDVMHGYRRNNCPEVARGGLVCT